MVKNSNQKIAEVTKKASGEKVLKFDSKNVPTLKLKKEWDIAMDFATKAYKKFGESIKSIILFGSTTKKTRATGSDIDIIIVIDDASIRWNQELIAWYREELGKILSQSPYNQTLHINTVKLTTWWEDLLRGDPIVTNILRNGEALVDMAGFFNPLKFLLINGKIKSTPEAIYNSLQRAPLHLARSKAAEINAVEGLYWAMVDSAHAALIAANVSPPSPEHIAIELQKKFVESKKLNIKYVQWFSKLLELHKKISHGEIRNLKSEEVKIDEWQEKTEEFMSVMTRLVKEIII